MNISLQFLVQKMEKLILKTEILWNIKYETSISIQQPLYNAP